MGCRQRTYLYVYGSVLTTDGLRSLIILGPSWISKPLFMCGSPKTHLLVSCKTGNLQHCSCYARSRTYLNRMQHCRHRYNALYNPSPGGDSWYLDHLTVDWASAYENEPCEDIPDAKQCALVLGGQGTDAICSGAHAVAVLLHRTNLGLSYLYSLLESCDTILVMTLCRRNVGRDG